MSNKLFLVRGVIEGKNFNELSSTTYKVIGTAANGCTSSQTISMYPNPFHSKLKVVINVNDVSNCNMILQNEVGERGLEKSITVSKRMNEINLNTSELNDGKYLILVYQNKQLLFVEKGIHLKGY